MPANKLKLASLAVFISSALFMGGTSAEPSDSHVKANKSQADSRLPDVHNTGGLGQIVAFIGSMPVGVTVPQTGRISSISHAGVILQIDGEPVLLR